jgi:tetratricopeptide (TPR) repeat protein
MAARTASRRLDLFGSVQSWRQALEAAEKINIEGEELSTAEESLGDAWEAAALYEEAVAAFTKAGETVTDPAGTARLNHKIGLSLIRLGRADEARKRLEEALHQAEAGAAQDIRLHAMVGIAGLEIRRGQVEEAGKWCDRVIAEGDVETNPSPIARAYYIRSLVSGRLGRDSSVEEARKALEIYESLGDKIGAANALNNLGARAFYTGAWSEAEDYHHRNLEARRSSGDVLGAALAGYNLGELFLEQGRYAEAQSLLERTLTDFRGSHHLVGESATRLTLGRLASRLGKVDVAVEQFDRAQQVATEADAGDQLTETTLGRAELALATGEVEEATTLLASLPEDLSGPSRVWRHLLESAARFASGQSDEARRVLELARTEAADVGAKHLEFAAVEMQCRLFSEGDEDADAMAADLGMLARPVFRIR